MNDNTGTVHGENEHRSEPKGRFTDLMEDVGFVIIRAVQGIGQSNVTIMASGLVYSTLVAIVPCITFFVAFLTVFDLLQPFMAVLGALLEDIFGSTVGDQLMVLIQQFSNNAMGLGVFGLVSFIITATFLVNKVYMVINQIFRTEPSNGNFRRFATFLTFLLVGVVFLALIISFNTSFMSYATSIIYDDGSRPANVLKDMLSSFVSFIGITAVLFLLYYFVPNTKIRTRSALLGSVTGSICLVVLFAVFKTIVSRTVGYSVIYGSLAAVLFLLVFLYACWYIILVSAEVIYVHQFKPESSQLSGEAETPSRQLTDAVNMMMVIGNSYKKGEGAITRKNLSRKLAVTPSVLGGYIGLLSEKHLIIEISKGKSASYVPARPLDQIYLKEIFEAIYGFDEHSDITTAGQAVAEQVKTCSEEAFASLTLENLLERV